MPFLLLQKDEKDRFRTEDTVTFESKSLNTASKSLEDALYDIFLTIKDADSLDAALTSGVGRMLLGDHSDTTRLPPLWTVAATKRAKHHALCRGGREGTLQHASTALHSVLHFLDSKSKATNITTNITIAGSHDTNMIPIVCAVTGLVDVDRDTAWLGSFGYNTPVLFRAVDQPGTPRVSLEVSVVVQGVLQRARWP
jgi:hypothetical protein